MGCEILIHRKVKGARILIYQPGYQIPVGPMLSENIPISEEEEKKIIDEINDIKVRLKSMHPELSINFYGERNRFLFWYGTFEIENKKEIIKENYSENTIHIFDLDETLTTSVSFISRSIDFLKESKTIKSMLEDSAEEIGIKVKDLKYENGRIFINDSNEEIQVKGNWVRKKGRIYLTPPTDYNYSKLNLPTELKKEVEIYSKAKNKMIITGRLDETKKELLEKLDGLGLEKPNYGFFCYPKNYKTPVYVWKSNHIIKFLKENNFKNVEYFDDNPRHIKRITRLVKSKLPDVRWKNHLIK